MVDGESSTGRIRVHLVGILLGLVILIGAVLRMIQYDTSVSGDEMSTLWIVSNNSLSGTLHVVSGDAEITPPLNFILAWFATRLGSAPELMRLPALICGVAAIPLTYLLGQKTLSEKAGLIAAAVMALSPFMTYFSGNGRAYTLMIAMLLASTLAMLKADETGRARWWVTYGAFSCLAMYSHYTSFFVLAAQLLWLFIFHSRSRKPAVLANLGAALAFLPWISGLRNDLNSPTTDVLEAIQGDGFRAKFTGVEEWLFGHPFLEPSLVPGRIAMLAITIGVLVAAGLTARTLWKQGRFRIPSGLALVLMIGLSTPLCELLLALVGTDLFGARNMTASWYGFALSIGAVLSIPSGTAATACTILVLGGYGIASIRLLARDATAVDFKGPAKVIDQESEPGDVVLDLMAAVLSPVPLSPLSTQVDVERGTYNLNLATSDPPFLPGSEVPDPQTDIEDGFQEARGHTIFMLAPDLLTVKTDSETGKNLKEPKLVGRDILLPGNATITGITTYDGYLTPVLYEIEVSE